MSIEACINENIFIIINNNNIKIIFISIIICNNIFIKIIIFIY